jgi:hypothetical protein
VSAPLAPSPPGVEVCSCAEALALRAELARVMERLAERERLAADIVADPGSRAFCPLCGVGVGFDEDGCCTSCGAAVCSLEHVVAHLGAAGLRLIERGRRKRSAR